jgi:hypothetical protein
MAADRAEIERMIRAADAAGDGAAVKVLFGELDKMGAAPPAPRPRGQSLDLQADGSLVPTHSNYGPDRQADQWIQAGKNVVQAGAQAATGITGAVAGDVAGLGALAYDTTANALLAPFRGSRPSEYADPMKVRENVSSALTYQPTDTNNLTAKVLQAPGKMIQGAGDFMAQATDNPYGQHALRAVPLAVASLLGVKAGGPATFNAKPMGGATRQAIPDRVPGTPEAPPPAATPEQVAIKSATDAGYKLSPSQTGNRMGATAEGMSGQAASERLLSKKNVDNTDNLAKKALGLDKASQLTPQKITELKVKANKAYNDVAKTGSRKVSDDYRNEINGINDRTGSGSFADDTPEAVTKLKQTYSNVKGFTAEDAVAKIRQLRKDATANFKTRDPEKAALGHAQRKVADALDNELERHVTALGKPELASNYKSARVQLAKINTVEQALSGANVSAKKIHQQWKRGAPLEGDLLAIARAYDNFGQVLQDAGKIRGKHPFTVVDAMVAAGASGAAGLTANPALLAAVAARPITRAAIASDFYQSRFVQPRGRKGQKSQPKQSKVAAPAASASATQNERRSGAR